MYIQSLFVYLSCSSGTETSFARPDKVLCFMPTYPSILTMVKSYDLIEKFKKNLFTTLQELDKVCLWWHLYSKVGPTSYLQF